MGNIFLHVRNDMHLKYKEEIYLFKLKLKYFESTSEIFLLHTWGSIFFLDVWLSVWQNNCSLFTKCIWTSIISLFLKQQIITIYLLSLPLPHHHHHHHNYHNHQHPHHNWSFIPTDKSGWKCDAQYSAVCSNWAGPAKPFIIYLDLCIYWDIIYQFSHIWIRPPVWWLLFRQVECTKKSLKPFSPNIFCSGRGQIVGL